MILRRCITKESSWRRDFPMIFNIGILNENCPGIMVVDRKV